MIEIARATPADAEAVFRLVEDNHLPLDGLREHLATTIVAREDGRIVERIDRAQVPETVKASVEFTSACPSSATVMRRLL
jgi:hypothetical protein